jgi:hypothetical protein
VRLYGDATFQSVPLGTLQTRPELSDLELGQTVLLVDPLGPLHAEGRIVLHQRDGVTYVYGVVTGPIEDE